MRAEITGGHVRASEPTAEPMPFSEAWEQEGGEPEAGGTPTGAPLAWAAGLDELRSVDTYWVATTLPDGGPHLVPVLAVVVDGALHFSASDRSRKARNLAADPHLVVSGSSGTCDLVVHGQAQAVSDEAVLHRIAEAYQDKYGWAPQVRQGALWAEGAPTAGPPPYRVFQVEPHRAFSFPTDDATVPTRWRFH